MFNNFGGPLREADSVPDDRRRLRPPHEAAILVRRVREGYLSGAHNRRHRRGHDAVEV